MCLLLRSRLLLRQLRCLLRIGLLELLCCFLRNSQWFWVLLGLLLCRLLRSRLLLGLLLCLLRGSLLLGLLRCLLRSRLLLGLLCRLLRSRLLLGLLLCLLRSRLLLVLLRCLLRSGLLLGLLLCLLRSHLLLGLLCRLLRSRLLRSRLLLGLLCCLLRSRLLRVILLLWLLLRDLEVRRLSALDHQRGLFRINGLIKILRRLGLLLGLLLCLLGSRLLWSGLLDLRGRFGRGRLGRRSNYRRRGAYLGAALSAEFAACLDNTTAFCTEHRFITS